MSPDDRDAITFASPISVAILCILASMLNVSALCNFLSTCEPQKKHCGISSLSVLVEAVGQLCKPALIRFLRENGNFHCVPTSTFVFVPSLSLLYCIAHNTLCAISHGALGTFPCMPAPLSNLEISIFIGRMLVTHYCEVSANIL